MTQLALREQLDGAKHWRTADARLALALTRKVAGLSAQQRGQVLVVDVHQALAQAVTGGELAHEPRVVTVRAIHRMVLDHEHVVGRRRLGKRRHHVLDELLH